MNARRFLIGLGVVGCLGLGVAAGQDNNNGKGNDDGNGNNSDKIVHETRTGNTGNRAGAASLIKYHGGPVILVTTNVYYIWYGNWSGNTATTILTDLASSIGGSPYFNINVTYYNGSNQ